MALAHKTVIGGLSFDRQGNVNVILSLLIIDGAREFSREQLPVQIKKGDNLAAKAAEMNATLVADSRQTLNAHEANIVGATINACWNAMDAP